MRYHIKCETCIVVNMLGNWYEFLGLILIYFASILHLFLNLITLLQKIYKINNNYCHLLIIYYYLLCQEEKTAFMRSLKQQQTYTYTSTHEHTYKWTHIHINALNAYNTWTFIHTEEDAWFACLSEILWWMILVILQIKMTLAYST